MHTTVDDTENGALPRSAPDNPRPERHEWASKVRQRHNKELFLDHSLVVFHQQLFQNRVGIDRPEKACMASMSYHVPLTKR